jgi:pilus assembly protein Flp/PilA
VSKLLAFLKDEDGPTAVECAVQLALVVACLSAISKLASNSNNTFRYVSTKVGKTSGS